jgi:hypothetical protein
VADTPVFRRVAVDFMTLGGARIQWELEPRFHALEPFTYQLQTAESDVAGANWTNAGPPVTNVFSVIDPTRRAYGKELNVFYRVKLTTFLGEEYTSPAAAVLGNLDIRSWRWAREFVRKEMLRLKNLHVGIDGVLLKTKRSGTPCPTCLDPFTTEVTDSGCPDCYGTRWLGGYYAPVPAIFGDVNQGNRYFQRDLSGEGMVNPDAQEGMFLALPFLSTGDIWINKDTDNRFHVHEIKVRVHLAGVPILTYVQLRTIPTDNVVYTVPSG